MHYFVVVVPFFFFENLFFSFSRDTNIWLLFVFGSHLYPFKENMNLYVSDSIKYPFSKKYPSLNEASTSYVTL